VVTKAELLDHVWSGMIVEEGNLSVQIAGLRKALGKEAIKTVPGVGYRLTLGARGGRRRKTGTGRAVDPVARRSALRQSHRG
jgi:DNA-binding winged helix-turn-helix (wHTH) protein